MRYSVKYAVLLLAVALFYLTSLYMVSQSAPTTCRPPVSGMLQETQNNEEQQQPLINPKLDEPLSDEGHLSNSGSGNSGQLIETMNVVYPKCRPHESDIGNNPSNRTRANAVIVILCRNSELGAMRRTMRQFEDRFNRVYGYPYVFLNDEPFTDVFKSSINDMTAAPVKFGTVPKDMWSIPSWVNETHVEECLEDYKNRGIMYGGSLSYRHMCRFNSGYFYRHPLLEEYEYYWRVEPGVSFFCDFDYDPFLFMQENGKMYGFTITLQEIPETIPTIWEHTLRFAHKNSLNTTLLSMFGDPESGYNLCHFWSNFEIASLSLWRDARYQSYFEYLDKTGNFFYERWGDAIVHSLAAGLFLEKSQVHFFTDIGYQHDNFAHCIDDGPFGKCLCPSSVQNFDYMWGSCLPTWNQYPYQGRRWDFLPNGDQILDGGRVVKRPDLVA